LPLGSILMLLSSVFPFRLSVTPSDWIGIGLAFVSAFFLSLYMVLVKMAVSNNPFKGDELLFFLTSPIVVLAAFATLILEEDWSIWRNLSTTGWIIWSIFSFGILLFGNILQISSIQVLGAPLVSTLLAVRLVSALLFSYIVLDEELSDIYQFIGAIVVLITITLYMWIQKRGSKK